MTGRGALWAAGALCAVAAVVVWWVTRDDVVPSGASPVAAPPAAELPATAPPKERATRPPDRTGWAAVAGTVRCAESGAPVVGARVSWFRRRPAALHVDEHAIVFADFVAAPVAAAVTAADGAFSMSVPDVSSWRAHVTCDGYAPAATDGAGERMVVDLAPVAAATELRFVDATSRSPVAGAVGHVYPGVREGPPTAMVVADGDGRVKAWLQGTESVLVLAEGRVPRWFEPPAAGGAQEVGLDHAAVVAGVVTWADGRPAAALPVSCDGGVAAPAADRVVGGTDAQGRFRFDVPDDGSPRRLRVWAGSRGDFATTVFPGDAHLRIRLEAPGWIRGVVEDPTGAPAAHFRIKGARLLGEGRFELGPLVPGVHEVLARAAEKASYAAAIEVVALRAGESRELRLVLRESPRSHVAVRVGGPGGEPVAGADVVVTDTSGRLLERARSVSFGWVPVQIPGPPGTPVRIRVELREHLQPWAPSAPVDVATGPSMSSPGRADIRLAAGRWAQLRVVDSRGDAVAGAAARVDGGGAVLRKDMATLLVAPGARFRVVAWAEGFAGHAAEHSADEVRDGALTIALDEGAEVTGRLDLAAGEGPDRLTVRIRSDPAEGAGGVTDDVPDGSTESVPAASGRFRVRGVRPGPATLLVLRDQAIVRRMPVRILPDGSNDVVDVGDVPFPRLAPLRARVLDELGYPVARAAVRITSQNVFESLESDADGRFAADLPRGEPCVVTVVRELSCAPPSVCAPGDDEVVVRVTRGACVLLRGAWDRAASVFARAADGGPEWEISVSAWDGGTALVQPVPPGRWTFRVVEGERSWERSVEVDAGAVVESGADR